MKRIRNVMVVETLQAEFEALRTKFNNTFYWCIDTNKLYKGANQVGDGTGDTLPAVTSEDNGDVLTVVEGAWDKAEASGESAFCVTFTNDNGTITADKTRTEIETAITEGLFLCGQFIDGGHVTKQLVFETLGTGAIFGCMNGNEHFTISIAPDNAIATNTFIFATQS